METIRTWDKTTVLAGLATLATVLSVGATMLTSFKPTWALTVSALSVGITAFCGRLQGHPINK